MNRSLASFIALALSGVTTVHEEPLGDAIEAAPDILTSGRALAEAWEAADEDEDGIAAAALQSIDLMDKVFNVGERLWTAFDGPAHLAAWKAGAEERAAARKARREARRTDTDGDGIPNGRDRDDDNDGTRDRKDPTPLGEEPPRNVLEDETTHDAEPGDVTAPVGDTRRRSS